MKEYIVAEHPDFPYEEPKPQELIRCKDCKNNPSTSVGWISCPMTGTGTRKPNDFCSYAEPKEK